MFVVIGPSNKLSGTFAGDQYTDEEEVTRPQKRGQLLNTLVMLHIILGTRLSPILNTLNVPPFIRYAKT